MRRRTFLRLAAASGTVLAGLPLGCGDRSALAPGSGAIDPRESPYGRWVAREGLPAFAYGADQDALPFAEWDPIVAPRTRRDWVMLGNRAIRIEAANDGTVALFDEGYGLRWLVAPGATGTGVSIVVDDDGRQWGSAFAERAGETTPVRTFGPTWFEVRDAYRGLTLERTILCPEGEVPWVLVHVRLALAADAGTARTLRHREQWALRPRFLNFLEGEAHRDEVARAAVAYDVVPSPRGLVASERFATAPGDGSAAQLAQFVIGPPAELALECVGGTDGSARVVQADGEPHPTLEIESALALEPGASAELWFRFGRRDAAPLDDPAGLLAASLGALAERLPRAAAPRARALDQEVPWHAALLTGGLAVDRVIGGHSLDQGSTYSYLMGFNGAARDPLQHALPLVYLDPARALSVLRNTCAWATPGGDLPYALDGAKRPTYATFRPSDQNLWALWLAAEYAAATGDLAAFDAPLAYHPTYGAPDAPLREHLRRQFRFFVDFVGRGEKNHVRILNADWNDLAISDSGVPRDVMIAQGSSVLNSAMASWVLGVFAGLADRLGESDLAAESRAQSDDLRGLVAQAWNGRWFHRAYAPGGTPVGDADCWLEVQPWALLCGAADADRARALLATIDAGNRAGSPLGARLRWPPREDLLQAGAWGDATQGGVWYAISMTLVWAAAAIDADLAWDELGRMTLGAHAAAYPEIWEGTLSGPDSWNAPESTRPGRTWAAAALFAMQAFPVNNLHSHAQPLLAYLRLLGIAPTTGGELAIGRGAAFASPSFTLDMQGHGSLDATGPVTLRTAHGTVRGGPGRVSW